MADESVLAPWKEQPGEERQAILAHLQAIADGHAKAGTTSGMESLTKKPVVEVYAARPYLETLVVHFMYDLRFYCRTIAGSDWDEHHLHLGEAVCRGGKVVSHEAVKEETSIPELECEAYDDAAAYRKRREEAVAEFRRDWLDMPFPYEAP